MVPLAIDHAVLWQDIECGAYDADLPLWRELAAAAGGPVLDVGAGTGRVSLDLARRGHDVIALDHDPALLAALRERAQSLPVDVVEADARDFEVPRRFALCLAPMQTVQLLGGRDGRARFLACALRCLLPGGLLAAALADSVEPFDGRTRQPVPDMREAEGWVYSSQPVAVRRRRSGTEIERRREAVSPGGQRTETTDVVLLDSVTATELEGEGMAAGYKRSRRRRIAPTLEHVGSSVPVLRAWGPG